MNSGHFIAGHQCPVILDCDVVEQVPDSQLFAESRLT